MEDCGQLAGSITDHLAESSQGYRLGVDLEYSEELHNSFPLAPERMTVQKEWMSEYQQELWGTSVEVIKLVPNLQQDQVCAALPQHSAPSLPVHEA